MSFYRDELERDTLWSGLDAPKPSRASIILAAYRLQEMTVEEKTERKQTLEAAFAKIGEDWEGEGFVGGPK